jgi:diacylglycerol O-acyltransferase / wax synthase
MGRWMAPSDAVWIRGDTPANRVIISAVLWFDRALDVPRMREVIERDLLARHPVFSQRVVAAGLPGVMPRWEHDPDFAIERHLSVVELPPPGDHADLQARCTAERNTPLDPERPLWSVTVYQGYRGGSALHVRIHHALGDGLALVRLLLSLVDELDLADVPIIDPIPLPDRARRLVRRTLTDTGGILRHPARARALLHDSAEAARWGVRLIAPVSAPQSILQGEPQGTKAMAWWPDGRPVAPLLDVAHAHGVTANDLLLSILAGGLRRHLLDHDALVDEVLVLAPVNLREPTLSLPRHLGNRLGLLPVLLPVAVEDPERRVALIHERMMRVKAAPAPAVSRAIIIGTTLATPGVERVVHRLNQRRSTGVVTNVIGPDLALHLTGARLLGAVGWGGVTGRLNLSGAFMSVGGQVIAGLVTDTAITPDPGRILDHVDDEWDLQVGPRPAAS